MDTYKRPGWLQHPGQKPQKRIAVRVNRFQINFIIPGIPLSIPRKGGDLS